MDLLDGDVARISARSRMKPHLSRLENWKDAQIYSTGIIGANFEFRQRRSGKFLDFSRIRKDRRRSP